MTTRIITAIRVLASSPMRHRLAISGAALALGLLASAGPANAAFGVASFDGSVTGDASGTPFTQAGGHPYEASTTIKFNTKVDAEDGVVPDEQVKNIEVGLPVGFVGDPTGMPKCSEALLETSGPTGGQCPANTQVGIAGIDTASLFNKLIVGIYNMEPSPGSAATFGFQIPYGGATVHLKAKLRSGSDYGVTIDINNIAQTTPIKSTTLILWGVPADPSHDALRGQGVGCGQAPTLPGDPNFDISQSFCAYLTGKPAGIPPKPFLTNPTDCSTGPVATTLKVDSWEHPGAFKSTSFITHDNASPPNPVGPTGCGRVPFDPSLTVQPTSHQPDAPSGYVVDLKVPQNSNPTGIAQSHLRRAMVTLPEGVTLSPSAADGLQGCSDAQIALTSDTDPTCPDASKIGTVSVKSPLLSDALTGSIYVGTQTANDPYRIFLVASDKQRGVIVKLPGSVQPDPTTGQLTTVFENSPELPFDDFHLEFKSGPRAPLANPPICGPKKVTSALSPWSGNAAAHPTDSFVIDCPAMTGFGPSFRAGTLNPRGGAFSPFVVRINRQDGQEYLDGVTVEMPAGLSARLRGVPLCADGDSAAGTCPVESRVGTATVGAGPGSNPFFLKGSASLAGPYKGAPYSLSVSVRAVAGPFDLGTVVVRQAVYIDPTDAHLTIVSDPLPTILKGIPLRLRSVNVDVDRPGFTLNPTSCGAKQIKATFHSQQGSTSSTSTPFQVADCQALPLSPKLALTLSGKRQTTEGKHPALDAVVSQPAAQANLKRVAATLPLSLALDPGNAQALCEYQDGLANKCPATSIVGSAKAVTPILNQPLAGPVYFVKGIRTDAKGVQHKTLPTLLIPLTGENGVEIDLRASSEVKSKKLVTTFANVPDAPISRFELHINGGRHGILVVTGGEDLCKESQVTKALIDGQNGKAANQAVAMRRANCGRGKTAK